MQAIFVTGGKQYKVSEGDVIFVEKLGVEADATITFDNVLMLIDGENTKIGTPAVDGATVTAKAVKSGKSKKVLVFKMKPKKNYRRRQGHRQPYTKIEIQKING